MLAAPKPSKSGELIDLLRAAGVAFELTEQDHKALKGSRLSARQVAEVYCAIALGDFGDDWLRTRLSVTQAIKLWPGYQTRKDRPRPTSAFGRVLSMIGSELAPEEPYARSD